MQGPDLIPVIPQLILLVGACIVLLVDPFLKPGPDGRSDKTAIIAIALVTLAGSIVFSLAFTGQSRTSFSNMLVLSDWAIFFNVLFAVAGGLTVLLSPSYLESHRRHLGEYYALLLFAIIGMDLMAAARDFILLWVALELMSLSSYLLAALFRYRERSNESALKYFLTGSFASAIMLYGVSLVYGLAGGTSYALVGKALADPKVFGVGGLAGVLLAVFLVAIGLAFKVSAVPFHQWIPDVYQGAPTPVAAFFSVGPKAAAFASFIASFILAFPGTVHDWGIFFMVLSILTMLVGNLYALVQTNIKRMLAYSSIAHAGYLLTGLAAMGWSNNAYPGRGVLVYLAAYTFMNLGAFGILGYLKTQIAGFDYSLRSFAGLGRRSPWAGLLLTLFLLSLTGIPGTAGFIGKFYVFAGVVYANLWWLAVIGVVLSAVSAYYYLRVVVYMFFREPEEDYVIRQPISGGTAMSMAVTAIATVAIGVAPQWLWEMASGAFSTLFK